MKNEDCNGTKEEKRSLSINGDGEEREYEIRLLSIQSCSGDFVRWS